MKVTKPLLSDVLKETVAYAKKLSRKTPFYNIEIKSSPDLENRFHPPLAEYCDFVAKKIQEFGMSEYVTMQSFDGRAMDYLHRKYLDVFTLSYLFEKETNYQEAIAKLGFSPDIISPDYTMINDEFMKFSKNYHMRVVPWTVNNLEEMRLLIKRGVSGIISDYPDLFAKL